MFKTIPIKKKKKRRKKIKKEKQIGFLTSSGGQGSFDEFPEADQIRVPMVNGDAKLTRSYCWGCLGFCFFFAGLSDTRRTKCSTNIF